MTTTVAVLPEVVFADGSRAAVELVLAAEPAPAGEVFAALAFVQDASGRFAVVYSPRRAEWASPGGWCEPGETPAEAVVREVLEETGLVLGTGDLEPCGYEVVRLLDPATPGRWPAGGGVLQVYRTRLDLAAPAMAASADDVVGHRWVSWAELGELCGTAFWWPLAEALFSGPGR